VEYAGPAIEALGMEGRMTICNMSIEFGARMGMIGFDEITREYVRGRPFAPSGAEWDLASADWADLHTDTGATFDREYRLDCTNLRPQVTWGNSPESLVAIDETVPSAAEAQQHGVRRMLDYMGLQAGQKIEGVPIDFAFIGSCTNSRLSDLQAAAEVARGRKVAAGVTALVVPGSMAVKAAAEALGLDKVFRDAGFEWRLSGCSMCVASNGDIVPPGKRAISTTNRNFEHRQGPNSRSHLASPAMVAAAAVTGYITDVRKLLDPRGAH
jgi:3-isopropylmalate/(R)-2-methylmalate dehydratase large subunit